MPLLSVHAVLALHDPERKYLQEIDDAIRDALFANTMLASVNGLDVDLICNAASTLLLVAAVREAMLSCQRANTTFDFKAFCNAATETAAWVLTRSNVRHVSALN